MKEIQFYQHTNNKVPVVEWLKSLDKGVRIRIQDRLTRIEQDDNFGDFKKLDDEKFNQLWENINKTFSVFHG